VADRHVHVVEDLAAGDRDPHLSPTSPGGWESHADDLAVRIVPGAGHLLAEQCPELVADAIRGFAGSERRG
jgi:pimeloyl-ACP methyl ester carboxylesterase